MHLGRERPPPNRPGTGSGGWQRGSLTPQMTASQQSMAALTVTTGGTERRPLHASEVADYQEHRRNARCQAAARAASRTDQMSDGRRGTTPPASVVPPCFLRFRRFRLHPALVSARVESLHRGDVAATSWRACPPPCRSVITPPCSSALDEEGASPLRDLVAREGLP